MHVVRWTRLPYLLRSRLPGTSELNSWNALPVWAAGRLRGWRANSPGCRSHRPTHATNSLSTRKLSLHLCPGSPCCEAGEPFGDTLHFFAEAARLAASSVGARRLLGRTHSVRTLWIRKLGVRRNSVRKRSVRILDADATARDTTPRTNSTHATGSEGGHLTKPCRTLDGRSKGYAGTSVRENDTVRGATTRLGKPVNTCTAHPLNFADVLFAFRRQGQYHFATCCLQGAAKAEKGLLEISTT